jgi:hypothetical protein
VIHCTSYVYWSQSRQAYSKTLLKIRNRRGHNWGSIGDVSGVIELGRVFLDGHGFNSVDSLGAMWALVGHVALLLAIKTLSGAAETLALLQHQFGVLSGNSSTCWGLPSWGWQGSGGCPRHGRSCGCGSSGGQGGWCMKVDDQRWGSKVGLSVLAWSGLL